MSTLLTLPAPMFPSVWVVKLLAALVLLEVSAASVVVGTIFKFAAHPLTATMQMTRTIPFRISPPERWVGRAGAKTPALSALRANVQTSAYGRVRFSTNPGIVFRLETRSPNATWKATLFQAVLPPTSHQTRSTEN